MKTPFAIVGCGRIGSRHAEHIDNFATLKAVCDIDPLKAKELGEKYQVPYFTDMDEMLTSIPDVEVVSICTPNGLHADHTVATLRAGKNVVCEKPMALSVSDCWRMIGEAEKMDKHLFIVKQNRFNPPVQKLKSVIDQGILGKVYSMQLNCFWNRNPQYYQESDWKGSIALDGGILYTQFSHFIDLMYWFLGDVVKVSATAANYCHQGMIEFEDTLVASMEFASGALGTMNCTINSYKKNMEGSISIFAEKGTVKIGGQYLNVLEYQNIEDHVIEDIEAHRPANDYGYYQGSMSNHDSVIKNVIDVLHHGGQIATNGYEGMKTVEIIEKIYARVDQASRLSTATGIGNGVARQDNRSDG